MMLCPMQRSASAGSSFVNAASSFPSTCFSILLTRSPGATENTVSMVQRTTWTLALSPPAPMPEKRGTSVE